MQVARFRSEGWNLLFARTVGLIAECERVLDARADFVKSCLELLEPRLCALLTPRDVDTIVGEVAEVPAV